ncbi:MULTISPECIES: keywimysin-related RiPP [Kineococcus]
MDKTYERPVIAELGTFLEQTGYGIGGQVEGWVPLTDRPL